MSGKKITLLFIGSPEKFDELEQVIAKGVNGNYFFKLFHSNDEKGIEKEIEEKSVDVIVVTEKTKPGTIKKIKEIYPQIKIVVWSAEEKKSAESFQAGADIWVMDPAENPVLKQNIGMLFAPGFPPD